jgi:hypothetical protein
VYRPKVGDGCPRRWTLVRMCSFGKIRVDSMLPIPKDSV